MPRSNSATLKDLMDFKELPLEVQELVERIYEGAPRTLAATELERVYEDGIVEGLARAQQRQADANS